MKIYDRFYINGEWQSATGTGDIDVRSASTEEVIARVSRGSGEDVSRAVNAARRAFDAGWSQTSPA